SGGFRELGADSVPGDEGHPMRHNQLLMRSQPEAAPAFSHPGDEPKHPGLGGRIVVKWWLAPRRAGARLPDKGLEEVVAAQTKLSDIDGKLGKLWYVGYDIHDLGTNSTFEEVVYLLQRQRLPTTEALDELNEQLTTDRDIS